MQCLLLLNLVLSHVCYISIFTGSVYRLAGKLVSMASSACLVFLILLLSSDNVCHKFYELVHGSESWAGLYPSAELGRRGRRREEADTGNKYGLTGKHQKVQS